MKSLQKLVIMFLCAVIAFSPLFAEARAGASRSGSSSSHSGSSLSHQSMGSRGSKTHDANGSKPIEKSMTAKPAPTPPRQAEPPARPAPVAPPQFAPPPPQPSFFQQHPFLAGVAGGVAGSLIGSLLFNHSRGEASVRNGADDDLEAASAASPAGRLFGSMLPFLLIAGLIMLGIWFYRRTAAQSLGAGMASTGYAPGPIPIREDTWRSSTASPETPETIGLPISPSDISAFKDLLVGIQEAWGKADLVRLKRMLTPEMLSYFSESLSNNASQGVENRVEQTTVLKQEVKEAWEEEDLQYATVLCVWSALDYTVNVDRKPGDPDYVTEGDMRQPVEAEETWTFVRSRGGHWLLSAIQQL